jgi:hypothetical protein
MPITRVGVFSLASSRSAFTSWRVLPCLGSWVSHNSFLTPRKLLAISAAASARQMGLLVHRLHDSTYDPNKLMDGVYKSGVLGPEAKPGQ